MTLTLYFSRPCRIQVGCSQSHPAKVNVIYIFLIVSIFVLTQFHLILQNVLFNIMQYSGCMSVQVCCCHIVYIGSISSCSDHLVASLETGSFLKQSLIIEPTAVTVALFLVGYNS